MYINNIMTIMAHTLQRYVYYILHFTNLFLGLQLRYGRMKYQYVSAKLATFLDGNLYVKHSVSYLYIRLDVQSYIFTQI